MRSYKKLVDFIISALICLATAYSAICTNKVLAQNINETIISPPPSRSYSLTACFFKSDQHNQDIIVARRNLEIAKAGIKIAEAIPNPLFEVQLGFGPSFNILFTGQTQQVFFTQQLQTAGKRSKKIALARANYDLVKLQFDALRFNIHNQVRRAYAELAAAEAYASLIEAQKEVAQKLSDIAQKRYTAGKIPKSDVLQADLNTWQFDIQHNQAQGRLEQASAALSLLIGDKPEHVEVFDVDDNGLFKLSTERTAIVPSPTVPLPNLDNLITTAYQSRPDLRAAEQQVIVSRKALTLAKAQRIPNLFIGAGFTFSTFSKNQPPGLVPQPNWLGQGAFLNVTAENPVFYQHQGEIQQAVISLRQSEKKVELLKSQIATGIVMAYNSASTTRNNIFVFQRELLPTAAQVAQIARIGYRSGATDLARAILAQQQYQQILLNYFDAVVAYQNAWADLEKEVGLPLNNYLSNSSEPTK